jgi:hypothetical protein
MDGTGTWTGRDGTVHGQGQKIFNVRDIGTFISRDFIIYFYLFTIYTDLLLKKKF